MRIYMAGLWTAGGRVTPGASVHVNITGSIRYPWMLESYHYIGGTNVPDAVRRDRETIFLDSGAFSMFTQGIKVDLKEYAAFVKRNSDIIHTASNLDVIGKGAEQETYDRQKQLEGWLGPNVIQPVHHVRDHDDWLRRYMDEGYDYIFLGGMVPESTPVLLQWLDHVWSKYLTNPDGTAKIKVHGFGLTTLSLIVRYPWFSVDSTRWVLASRFGMMFMDFPQLDGTFKDYTIDFSSRSRRRYDLNSWHFGSLKPDEQEVIRARLAEMEAARPRNPHLEHIFKQTFGVEMGYTPEALAISYGLRDMGNVEFFRRMQERRAARFVAAQETLF